MVGLVFQKAKKSVACTMCRNFRAPAEMVDSADSDGKLEMFCSTGCVTAYKVQTVSSSGIARLTTSATYIHLTVTNTHSFTLSLSLYHLFTHSHTVCFKHALIHNSLSFLHFNPGARVECNTCGQKTVPSFHLAMSDGSIRNFCTMNCVVTFQVTPPLGSSISSLELE